MEDWDIRELLVMIFRKKISIIIIIAMFIIAGFIYTYNYTTPMYDSNARIVLGKISTMDGEFLDRNVTISETDLTLNSSLILTYSELAKSRSIMEEVKDRLQYDISVDNLLENVTVTRINASDLLQVTATNADPKVARDIVSEVVDVFSGHIKEIYKIDNVYIIDRPTVATVPFNIHHEKDIATFALIGTFTACVYVVLCIFIDNTIKNSNEIENLLKVRTLISIPIDKKKQGELITVNDGKSVISESFKTLRTNVQFSSVDSKGSQVMLVTSCMPSEGKSYVSANLAIAFAQTGKRVIIVDSDMRRGRQCRVFNVPNKNGLSNYISNIDSNGYEINWSLGEYIKKTHISNLDIITAGSVPPNPAELLASTRLVELIEDLKKYYDVIIFDGAPILPITDSLLLGRTIGKVMLVAVYNKTKKDNLIKAKESIEDVGGKVIGIVLNKVSMDSGSYGDGYYYYGEGEKGLTRKEKIEKAVSSKVKQVKKFLGNEVKKAKSFGKRLSPAKTAKEIAEAEKISQLKQKALEERRIQREIARMQKEEERKKIAEEKRKIAEAKAAEKARLEKIKAEERAKEQAIREAEARLMAEEKAKMEAEIAKAREAERIKREEERAKQQAIRAEQARKAAEEKARLDALREKQRAKEQALKEAEAKKLAEERAKEQAIKEEQARIAAEEKARLDAIKAEQRAKEQEAREQEVKKAAEEREKQQKIRAEQARKAAEERAKIEAVRAQERAKFEAIRAQERAKLEAQREKERAEQEAIMREEARIMAEEKAKEDAIMAEEMLRMQKEEAMRKQEELARRAEERKRNAELKAKKRQERAEKFNDFRGRILDKKDEIKEELKIKKAEYANKYSDYKIRKQENKILAAEDKARRQAELAKAREAERIKREEERKVAAEERAKRLAELEAQKAERLAKQAEERAKREEQARIAAEEKARREAELARIREEEKLRKEQEKRIAAEEKAKQIAILAEEKAKREAEAKLTDEYLQENLYPKTKYNKF